MANIQRIVFLDDAATGEAVLRRTSDGDWEISRNDGGDWEALGGVAGRWEVVMTGSAGTLEPVTNEAEDDWLYTFVED